jgi:hypothetical protein
MCAVAVTPLGGAKNNAMQVIGSFLPMGVFKVTGADGEGTSADIVIPGFKSIEAVFPLAIDGGNNNQSMGMDITWSGNTITIADGGDFDLSADGDTLYLLVVGQVNV